MGSKEQKFLIDNKLNDACLNSVKVAFHGDKRGYLYVSDVMELYCGEARQGKGSAEQQHPTAESAPLEYEEWSARPCCYYDECTIKNKNLHCYANKPCFK